MPLNNQQRGRCGELLVQQRLLRRGIESAPMTTDFGIDLVAYSRRKRRATTIQVKTNEKPKPAGGKGRPTLDWWVDEDCPADWFAFVCLEDDRIWMLKKAELSRLAQQKSKGRHHLYMYIGGGGRQRTGKKSTEQEFADYLLEERIQQLFSEESLL